MKKWINQIVPGDIVLEKRKDGLTRLLVAIPPIKGRSKNCAFFRYICELPKHNEHKWSLYTIRDNSEVRWMNDVKRQLSENLCYLEYPLRGELSNYNLKYIKI